MYLNTGACFGTKTVCSGLLGSGFESHFTRLAMQSNLCMKATTAGPKIVAVVSLFTDNLC